MRVCLTLALAILLVLPAAAQHRIPPLPETAGKPVKLRSGVTVVDIKQGTGVEAEAGRMVRIYFTGWVTKTQVMFDYRDAHTGPLVFRLGDSETMKGLQAGVYGMRVGGRRRVLIPPSLGYGSSPTKLVPANSRLTCDIELIAVARPGV